jgi:drug/metabolite transporter (DMT)-like permease
VLTIRNIREKRTIKPVGVLAGFVLGSLNFGATYYFVRSMKLFESAFLFPVVNAGIVSLVAIIGFLFFNEKLSKYNWIGILTAVVAIIMISRG